MNKLPYILLMYLIAINIIAFILTRYDKSASKIGGKRIRENTLMLVGLLGGSPVMYITMKIIHHKTKHSLFMVGLPLILIIEVLLILFLTTQLHLFN